MPRTYEPIAFTTLGSNAATVTFDNIPATYTDLVVVGRFGIQDGKLTEVYARFNSDSGTNYSVTELWGNGSITGSGRASNSSLGCFIGGTDATANNIAILHVFSYANTNVNKTTLSVSASPGRGVGRNVALWRSTAAITRMDISRNAATNDIVAGSVWSLYGIKAA
jgi:hypothetical protein